eukprot:2630044-Pleurochrysis_carterae.AAC.1
MELRLLRMLAHPTTLHILPSIWQCARLHRCLLYAVRRPHLHLRASPARRQAYFPFRCASAARCKGTAF